MGSSSSKPIKYKVLLLGLDGAGKTTLLYKLRLKNAQAEFFSTKSFNHEICNVNFNQHKYELQMWDLAGRQELRKCWQYFYNSMSIDIMIYVVSAKEPHRLRDAAINYKRLVYETSMLKTKRIVVINSFAIRDVERAFEVKEDEVRHLFGSGCEIITMNAYDPTIGMRRLFRWISDLDRK